jgi:uncharacterized protein (TIGR02246 family)
LTVLSVIAVVACSQPPAQPAAPVTPAPPAVDTAAEEAALTALGDRYVELFAAKDSAGLTAMYTPDAVRIVAGQPSNKGVDAIRAAIQQGFTDGSTSLAVNADETIVAENGRAAVSYGTYTVEVTPPKGKPASLSGNYMNVLTKGDAGWKIARSLVAPAPAPPAAR